MCDPVCVCVCVCVYAHTCVLKCFISSTTTHYALVPMSPHTHAHTHTHAHPYAHTYACMHTHTHTHTWSTSGMRRLLPGLCWETLVKSVLAELMMLPIRWSRVRGPPIALPGLRDPLPFESGVPVLLVFALCPLSEPDDRTSLYAGGKRSSEDQGTTEGSSPTAIVSASPESLLAVWIFILPRAATETSDSLYRNHHRTCTQHTQYNVHVCTSLTFPLTLKDVHTYTLGGM